MGGGTPLRNIRFEFRNRKGFEKYSGISRPRHLSVHTRPPEFFGIADAKFLVNMQIKSYLHRGLGDLGSLSNNAKCSAK